MKYKGIIFDLDGTIADTIPLTVHCLREATKELTGKVLTDEYILSEFGPVDTEIMKIFVGKEKGEESAELYLKYFSDNFCTFVKPIDGIKELLNLIKSKEIKIALFTGRGLKGAHIVLEKLGIIEYFNEIIAGEHTKNCKPDPEGINLALNKLHLLPCESMYVGDFEADIRASKAAGVTSVLALWSSTSSEKLIEHNPDKYFKSPYEFMEWLK